MYFGLYNILCYKILILTFYKPLDGVFIKFIKSIIMTYNCGL